MNQIPGYMSNIECRFLGDMFRPYNRQDCLGVEVGSLHGRSSVEISQAIPLGKLICIDVWYNFDSSTDIHSEDTPWIPKKGTINSLDFFQQNTANCKNILAKKGSSPKDFKYWQDPIDFLFLDSDHRNPSDWDNIEFWLPKIKKGGLLSGHDFYSCRRWYPDVHDNVKKLEQILNQKVTNPMNTSLWYFYL